MGLRKNVKNKGMCSIRKMKMDITFNIRYLTLDELCSEWQLRNVSGKWVQISVSVWEIVTVCPPVCQPNIEGLITQNIVGQCNKLK
jgi:hypothetical protein